MNRDPWPRALLVDAVGVLVALREPPPVVYRRVAARNGIELELAAVERSFEPRLSLLRPPCQADIPRERIPELEREGWRALIRDVLGSRAADGPAFEELFDLYASAEAWQVVEGAVSALANLRAAGSRTAVVSNMDARLPELLAALGLARLFDEVVIPANSGLAKPDPRIFHLALERLGIAFEGALYLGDRLENCVEAARRAGLRALLYDPAGDPSDPDVLTSWDDLAPRLRRRSA